MAKSLKYFCFWFFLLAWAYSLSAQPPNSTYSGQIAGFGKDDYWFTWLGTSAGIFRYDGANYRHYKISEAGNPILHDQNVQSDLFTGSDGRLWFTTYKALHALEPETGIVKTFQVPDSLLSSKQEYKLFHLRRESDELWLAAGYQLYYFNLNTNEFSSFGTASAAYNFSVYEDSIGGRVEILGCPWQESNGLEIFSVDPLRHQISKQTLADSFVCVTAAHLPNGEAYVGTHLGLYRLDRGESNYALRRLEGVSGAPLPKVMVRDLKINTSENGLIFTCPGVGAFNYTPLSGSLQVLGQGDYFFEKIYIDFNERIWTTIGEASLSPVANELAYRYIPLSMQISDAISVGEQRFVLLTEDGNFYDWPCNSGDELPVEIASSSLVNGRMFTYSSLSGISIIGDDSFGLFEPTNGKIDLYHYPQGFAYGYAKLTDFGPLALLQNALIKPTINEDVLRWDTIPMPTYHKKPEYTKLFNLSNNEIGLPYQTTNFLKLSVYENKLIVSDSFYVGFQSTCAIQTKSTALYVGTKNGLYRCVGDSVVNVLTEFQNSGNISIHTMIEGDDGNLWLGTNRGLLSYSPKNEQTTRIIGLERGKFLNIRPLSFAKDSLLFFTDGGAVIVPSQRPMLPKRRAAPYLAAIWVNNAPYQSENDPAYLNKLNFSHSENSLRFSFGLLDPSQDPACKIEYRLLGFDPEIKITQPENVTDYPLLPTGKYQLLLRSLDQHNRISGESLIPITIHPPFYHTWWFRITAIAVLIGLVAGIYVLLLRRTITRQARIRENELRIANERDRIAGEVHDDLGGQLSSILFLSESLLLEAETNEETASRELNRIYELSSNSLRNIQDIIFALDNRKATLMDLTEQLEKVGQDFFADRSISFTLRREIESPTIQLSSKQKRALTLIVKEAFHNSFKHARANWVRLSITEVNRSIHIKIVDDGIGFQPSIGVVIEEKYFSNGFGLQNMRKKATSIGATCKINSNNEGGATVAINWELTLNND